MIITCLVAAVISGDRISQYIGCIGLHVEIVALVIREVEAAIPEVSATVQQIYIARRIRCDTYSYPAEVVSGKLTIRDMKGGPCISKVGGFVKSRT